MLALRLLGRRQRVLLGVVVALLVALAVGVPLTLVPRDGAGAAPRATSGPGAVPAGSAARALPNGSPTVAAGGSAASEGGPSAAGSETGSAQEQPPGAVPRSVRRAAAALAVPSGSARSARGQVVAGFPRAVVLVPGSRVTSSSVSPAGRRAQVALTATVGAAPGAVVSHFRAVLRAAGMRDDVAASVPGSRAVRFSDGTRVLVLTVTPRGSGSAYSLVGVLPTQRSAS